MSYCTIDDLRRVLPEKISIGDKNIGTPSPGRPTTQRSTITPQEAQYYISYAQQYIDARLRPMYSCPLRRVKSYEAELMTDISPGARVLVSVRDAGAFELGQLIRLQSKDGYENCTITAIVDFNSFFVNAVNGSYSAADGTIVSILEFPDPIPIMTARFASAFLLDRLFSSEQSPDVSSYGKTQRNLARGELENILTGEALLFGQEYSGRRFVRGTLIDAYRTPADIFQKGQEKE